MQAEFRLVAAPAVTHLPPGSKVLGPSLNTRGEDKEVPSVPCSPAVPSGFLQPCSSAECFLQPCSSAECFYCRAECFWQPCSSAECFLQPFKPCSSAERFLQPFNAECSAECFSQPCSSAECFLQPSMPSVSCSPSMPSSQCSHVQVNVEKFAMQLASQPAAINRSDMEQLCRALPLEEPHQGQDDCDGAFRAGMYIKGGIVGLHKSCRTHPRANKAIARYVLEQAAAVGFSSHFTSAVVLVNTKTDPHKDQANTGEENIIIPVTRFEDGGLWVKRAGGATFRVVGNERVPGVVLKLQWEAAYH